MISAGHLLTPILGVVIAVMLCAAGCTNAPSPNTTTDVLPTTPAPSAPLASLLPGQANLTVQDELAARAAAYAAGVDGDALARAMAQGTNSTDFVSIHQALRAFLAADPQAVYIYTVEQVDGRSRFMVDAAYGTPNGSSPGDVLVEVPNGLPATISTPGTTGIYTDSWGTFISGYAPVRNRSGSIVGVLVVDVRPDALE